MQIVAVHKSRRHLFSKETAPEIHLVEGRGVVGDAHFGQTVQHRSRVAKDPTQPNLRQVHLLQSELFARLREHGLELLPGHIGENVTTSGIDLLALSTGTRLRLGQEAIIEITGLRNPCHQNEAFRSGLLAAVLDRSDDGQVVRKAGVMAVVVRTGFVKHGDSIAIEYLPPKHSPLRPV